MHSWLIIYNFAIYILDIMSNTIGHLFRLTSFGESHGKAMGGVIDGCPAGFALDFDFIQARLDERRPGNAKLGSARKEVDSVEFLSGIFEGKTLGSPIAFVIYNSDAQSSDYEHLRDVFRPSHADYTYHQKYGIRDHRGGGRASARDTVSYVVGGAIAEQLLRSKGIQIEAYVSQIGEVKLEKSYAIEELSGSYENVLRCPDAEKTEEMMRLLSEVRKAGDTVGGVINGIVHNAPAGLGEPVFDKLQAALGKAFLGINAVKGVEFGAGFSAVVMRGSQHNDKWKVSEAKVETLTNHSGGIQGGISNGMDIEFRIAFKPVATLMQGFTVLKEDHTLLKIEGKGRHDVCPVPRAVPVVRALTAVVLLDQYLMHRAAKNW